MTRRGAGSLMTTAMREVSKLPDYMIALSVFWRGWGMTGAVSAPMGKRGNQVRFNGSQSEPTTFRRVRSTRQNSIATGGEERDLVVKSHFLA